MDELRYIEQEAREQGDSDYYLMLVEEAYALFVGIHEARQSCTPRSARFVRLGKLRYRAWKRWERRKHAAADVAAYWAEYRHERM